MLKIIDALVSAVGFKWLMFILIEIAMGIGLVVAGCGFVQGWRDREYILVGLFGFLFLCLAVIAEITVELFFEL